MALRSIILGPGECATLPSTAIVQSITIDGAISITSDCTGLPSPSGYTCYKFTWEEDDAGSFQVANFVSLIIGSNIYNVPSTYSNYNTILIADWIDTDPQFGGIVKLGCDTQNGNTFVLKLKIPTGLPVPQLKVQQGSGDIDPVTGSTYLLTSYLVGEVDTDCDTCP